MPCVLLDVFSHVIVAVEIEDVRDEIQRILVVINFCVQARQVESVGQVLFVDFAEVFVSSR